MARDLGGFGAGSGRNHGSVSRGGSLRALRPSSPGPEAATPEESDRPVVFATRPVCGKDLPEPSPPDALGH